MAVLILLISLSLLSTNVPPVENNDANAQQQRQHATTNRLVGLCFGPVAIAVMAYAIAVYHWRTRAIIGRVTLRYDDTFGPTALVLILMVVAIACVSLAAISK